MKADRTMNRRKFMKDKGSDGLPAGSCDSGSGIGDPFLSDNRKQSVAERQGNLAFSVNGDRMRRGR